MKNVYVMVYGTLKRNYHNHSYMTAAQGKFIDTAKSSSANYEMVGIGDSFPGLIGGDSYFSGEVFEVPISGITNVLDYLEGYPLMYDRGFISVTLDSTNENIDALVYYLTEDSFQRLNRITKDSYKLKLENNCYTWK